MVISVVLTSIAKDTRREKSEERDRTMQKKYMQIIYKELNDCLLEKDFLQQIELKKKNVIDLLKEEDWKENIRKILADGRLTCTEILESCKKTMNLLSKEEPREGWLSYTYHFIIQRLFPRAIDMQENLECKRAVLFYLAILKLFLRFEEQITGEKSAYSFHFLSDDERDRIENKEEYLTFQRCFEHQAVYELMRIGGELTTFNALGHVSGVHNIAMHVARQLFAAGIPIDLGLVSAAAATHDIGKYGCRASESNRIPYLHYYYTNEWLQRNHMPATAHIASNHSTWDLELENLPVESLVLIYADFRVRSNGVKNGKEQIAVFTLKGAFRVILNKLDNVDFAKENRYRHVYAKLVDFEDYMVGLGVNVDLSAKEFVLALKKDSALLSVDETVNRLKHMAISHNIKLMSKISGEISFGNVLEAARSEKNWKNSRAYINLFEEYFTYMTQKQKELTLNFLYELLMHREGDIRRQAADLMGNIIVHFDEEYRKEIPEDVVRNLEDMSGGHLWERYLDLILLPDHRVTQQHRRWIGYTLKIVVESVLARCKPEERGAYLQELLKRYENGNIEDEAAFILIDTALAVPLDLLLEEQCHLLISFVQKISCRTSMEVKIGALRFMKYFTERVTRQDEWMDAAKELLDTVNENDHVSLRFLGVEISQNWDIPRQFGVEGFLCEQTEETTSVVSDIFLENLKTGTPWAVKAVNIELLQNFARMDAKVHVLHVATHLSNLLKVSERIAVRHGAGRALLDMAPLLSRDQRNEVAIELMKGLETGEYEFSKYIPEYLGEFVLYLYPAELDELINDLKRLLISSNERVVCVTLDTLGVILQHDRVYGKRFGGDETEHKTRRKKVLGMLLSGLASYVPAIHQEAFLVIGQYLFGGEKLDLEERAELFALLYKKLVTLVPEQEINDLTFFNNAASLNHIYRFIGDYLFKYGRFSIEERNRVAFFPGTFDPFSLSHKEIAREIRDLGFTVYLALDEFSWSKKAQPRMIRRRIITMSVANEEEIHLFTDDVPVNIANPRDLKKLKELFKEKELYIVVGSDVVENASSYKLPVEQDSIHSMNHIVFLRDSMINGTERSGGEHFITGDVIKLKLPMHLEDISSTRIRENVDYNRDISNLIDPVAQNYIYENSLYLREPQYKPILQARAIRLNVEGRMTDAIIDEILNRFSSNFGKLEQVEQRMRRMGTSVAVLRDEQNKNEISGALVFRQISTMELYNEFRDTEVVNYIRENTSGKMMLIDGIFLFGKSKIVDREQLLLTEALAYSLKRDFTYCIFSSNVTIPWQETVGLLKRQGFVRLPQSPSESPVYVVDMKSPVTVFKNIETALKEPFNRNFRILSVIDEAHRRMQEALTDLYPGHLILSFSAPVVHHKLVKLITAANRVPEEPLPVRKLGDFMCVPFGKILRGVVVPNTVTKALHTEKTFEPELRGFRITEYPNYSSLANQIRTIKSFNRPVILVDDLLHKGYRIKELNPLFQQERVNVNRLAVGILSGRGKDLMAIQNRKVESVYFLPNMEVWFVESTMYPFIGGDTVNREERMKANLLNSVNMILPYVMPSFLNGASREAIYRFSMTCLQNARDILKALEEEYQGSFERKLTLNRLSEVIISPSCPDRGNCFAYDYHLAASVYVENDIEKLERLKGFWEE